MNRPWTPADETLFQDLKERREDVLSARRAVLEEALQPVVQAGPNPWALVNAVINNADAILDALKPYDSGIRLPSTR